MDNLSDKIYYNDGLQADGFVRDMIYSGCLQAENGKYEKATEFYLYSEENKVFVEIDIKSYGYQVIGITRGIKAKELKDFISGIGDNTFGYMKCSKLEV